MKLIKPSFEILTPTDWREFGFKKFIELVGRTCYKSEDKITDNSYTPFVQRMIDSKHYAMLEHGTLYLDIIDNTNDDSHYIAFFMHNKYSKVCTIRVDGVFHYYVTTNYRVIIENHKLNVYKYLCEPTEHHVKRYTVKFICNRQVSHEFVRHRVFSFAQESTRYCNYTKDKFGSELTFIQPCWCCNKDINFDRDEEIKYRTFEYIEKYYFQLINLGWKPQQAATILPNALKTELVMTGFTEDWEHFFALRAIGVTGAPHPQAKELAEPLMKKFLDLGYLPLKTT